MSIVLNGTTGITTPSIDAAAGNSDLTTLSVAGNEVSAVNGLSFRNRIINGDMRISQRGSVTINPGGSGKVYCAADRWNITDYFGGTGQIVSTIESDVPSGQGFTSSLKMSCTTTLNMSFGSMRVRQYIEGFNIADAYTGNITISFWVKSSVTGSYAVQVCNSDFSRTYNAEFIVASANTWEKKTVVIPLSVGVSSGTWYTDNQAGIQLTFALNSSSKTGSFDTWQSDGAPPSELVSWGTAGDTFFVTGVQLEAGSVATPFERRPYGTELALCQRYYYRISNPDNTYRSFGLASGYNAIQMRLDTVFPVPMRTAPSSLDVSAASSFLYEKEAGYASSPSAIVLGSQSSAFVGVSVGTTSALTAGGAVYHTYSNGVPAYLGFSAEL